jgi:hypothetical protein
MVTTRGRFIDAELAELKRIMRARMIAMVRDEELATYTEFGDSVGMSPRSSILHRLLTEISREEARAGREMLSAVVVRANTGIPSEGFFLLATELGRNNVYPRRAFWQREIARLRAEWTREDLQAQ